MSVLFFSSEIARALAPSSPILLSAACTAPNPHTASVTRRQGGATCPATGPDARAPPNCKRESRTASCARPRAAAVRRGTAPRPSLPSHRAQSRAPPRSSLVSVLFFSSEIARALAPSAPMRFPAACTAPDPHGKRHADKEEPRARQRDPTPHARARPPNCTSAGLANCTSESRSALCARARPPAVGPRPPPPATEHRAAHIRGGAS